jgi:peptide/nickel transport system permease protein
MARYVITRALLGALTIIGIVLMTFILQFMVPGDPARRIAGPRADQTVLAAVRANEHLDDPVTTQLLSYVEHVAQGDLGLSYIRRRPVWDMLAERLPATLQLATAGLLIEILLGSALGLWDGLRRRRSSGLAAMNILLLSIPTYTLGFLFLYILGYKLSLLPLSGGPGFPEIVMPALTLGLFGVPYYATVVSESIRVAASSPYARTAVAKGLSDRQVVRRHLLRNCLSPVITLAGLDVALYVSGVVFVETVFAWPGIGVLAEESFQKLDRPVLMGTVILGSILVVVFNLVADIVRALVDPRTRAESA